jgi:hypothetical protein
MKLGFLFEKKMEIISFLEQITHEYILNHGWWYEETILDSK